MSAILRFECTICHDRFPTSFTRSSHLAKAHLDLLCRQCNRYYLSKLSLQQHYRDDPSHPTCPQCNEGFPSNSMLSGHVSTAHPPVQCGCCGLSFKDNRLLEEHFLKAGVHPACILCDKGFYDSLSYDQHIQTEHPDLYCDVCARGFQSHQHLYSHYREAEWTQHPTCVICDQGFKTHDVYNEHMISRHPPTPANISPASSTPSSVISLPDSLPHLNDQQSSVTCVKCNKQYKSEDDLSQHFKRSSQHPTCVQCGTGLFDDLAFFKHKIVAHKHSQEGSPTSNHRSSPGGVFALDEDLEKSRQDARPTDNDIEAATSKNWTTSSQSRYGHNRFADQPSPIASSYLATSLYLEEEVDSLADDFEIVPASGSDPSATPKISMMEQSLSYRSAPLSPKSEHQFSDYSSPSSVRRSEVFATPGIADSEQGSPRSQSSYQSPSVRSFDTSRSGYRIPSRPPSIHSLLNSPRTTRPVTSLDDISHAQTQEKPCSPVKPLAHSPKPTKSNLAHNIRSSSYRLTSDPATHVPDKKSPLSTIAHSAPTSHETVADPAKATLSWACRICLKEPLQPTATVCGHLFCNDCIMAELSKSLQCPVCRRSLLISLFLDNA